MLLNTFFCVSGSRSQQLCVKLEPRGLLYVKLSLQERWDTQVRTHMPNTAEKVQGGGLCFSISTVT